MSRERLLQENKLTGEEKSRGKKREKRNNVMMWRHSVKLNKESIYIARQQIP